MRTSRYALALSIALLVACSSDPTPPVECITAEDCGGIEARPWDECGPRCYKGFCEAAVVPEGDECVNQRGRIDLGDMGACSEKGVCSYPDGGAVPAAPP